MAHVRLQERARVDQDGLDPIAVYVRNKFVAERTLIKNSVVVE
jgi:hypothetical protein